MSSSYVESRKQLHRSRCVYASVFTGLLALSVMSLCSFFYLLKGNAMDHPLNSIFAFLVYIVATVIVVALVTNMIGGEADEEE